MMEKIRIISLMEVDFVYKTSMVVKEMLLIVLRAKMLGEIFIT